MKNGDDGYIIRLSPQKRGLWLAALFRVVGNASDGCRKETRPLGSARGESIDQALRELGASGQLDISDVEQ